VFIATASMSQPGALSAVIAAAPQTFAAGRGVPASRLGHVW
jgi:hypothetical protein